LNPRIHKVVWRGPRKNGLIKQFLTDTCWDEEGLDYLLIDTPPGTSDEHISTVQYLQGALNGSSDADGAAKLGGAIMVTTPEEVAMMDVRKELNFCTKTKLPVLGLVENMSKFQTTVESLSFLSKDANGSDVDRTDDVIATLKDKCPEVLAMFASATVFAPSGNGPRGMATQFQVPYLGAVPLDPNLLKACEEGKCFVQAFPDSAAASSMNSIADQVVNALPLENDEDMVE